MPKISVVMPVYNAERYLQSAIDSILNQTFTDFEFVIVDDCSTDATPALLDAYDDPRILRLRNDHNMGIVGALNRGFDMARGEYIARMDSDDLSFPTRLAAQAAYLDAHPEVGLLGTKYIHIDNDGTFVHRGIEAPPPYEPNTPDFLQWSLLWATTIQHPTAMLRRELFQQHGLRYTSEYDTAEDYELWTRINQHAEVHRLKEVHLHYRVNIHGISLQRRQRQLETHYQITYAQLGELLGEPPPDDLTRLLFSVVIPEAIRLNIPPQTDIVAAMHLLFRIRQRFYQTHLPEAPSKKYINQLVVRYLARLLKLSKEFNQPRAQHTLRVYIFRESPSHFIRMGREWVVWRLRRVRHGTGVL